MANYCSNCGGKLDAAVKFCTNCGSPAAGGSSVPLIERDESAPSKSNHREEKVAVDSASDPPPGSSGPSDSRPVYSGALFQSVAPLGADAEANAWFQSARVKVAVAVVLSTAVVAVSVIMVRTEKHPVPSHSKTSVANAPAPHAGQMPTAPPPAPSPVHVPASFTPNHRVLFVAGTPTDQAAYADVASSKALVRDSFDIAYEDLKGDGNKEIILQSTSTDFCGSGGCETLVLERRGTQYVTLLDQNLFSPLAVTNETVNGYAALASVDNTGAVAIDEQQGTPMYGKQMVYPMTQSAASQSLAANVATKGSAVAGEQSDQSCGQHLAVWRNGTLIGFSNDTPDGKRMNDILATMGAAAANWKRSDSQAELYLRASESGDVDMAPVADTDAKLALSNRQQLDKLTATFVDNWNQIDAGCRKQFVSSDGSESLIGTVVEPAVFLMVNIAADRRIANIYLEYHGGRPDMLYDTWGTAGSK